ncbi:MAG: TraM recognition domain-containing protein [Alphaproteobacteria bacterium]|nr:MAG: TraM recognition domain-containing protein [Alphaproteobacteria bacterium]
MAFLERKYRTKSKLFLRDVRPMGVRIGAFLSEVSSISSIFVAMAVLLVIMPELAWLADIMLLVSFYYLRWLGKKKFQLPLRLPMHAKMLDPNNPAPGKSGPGKAEGILYLGNAYKENNEEIWLTNNDARTHILYLGTTGAGKTEGLKSICSNALCWGSGFVYVDGKADNDLWSSLYAMTRRFGRDDDLLVLNYMTGNSDDGATSNSMNPFTFGSSSYLANMMVNLMPDAGGDNAMWKERAVALIFALMPALTYLRDKKNVPLDIGSVRDYIELGPIVKLSRNTDLPDRIARGLQGYLATLPGFSDEAFDDEGHDVPPSPDKPMYDMQVARQQHGYLSMQFTRALQSLADEYGYIFKAQLADIDMIDVVLNRRIMVVLIPALEKAGDEAANLGKIVVASLKGMMGATLGANVEGAWEESIDNKMTRASSPYITVFDEVGYYTAQGMAVMAAQARSLGFSLVFSAQDLPAMEKRIKQEARSITGNCNIKIFGKIEDPVDTIEFYNKRKTTDWAVMSKSYKVAGDTVGSLFDSRSYMDTDLAGSAEVRTHFSSDDLLGLREGEAALIHGGDTDPLKFYLCDAGKVKALRVQKLLPVPGSTSSTGARERLISDLGEKLRAESSWSAATSGAKTDTPAEIAALSMGYSAAVQAGWPAQKSGGVAVAALAENIAHLEQASQASLQGQSRPMPGGAGGKTASPSTVQPETTLRGGDDNWQPEPPFRLHKSLGGLEGRGGNEDALAALDALDMSSDIEAVSKPAPAELSQRHVASLRGSHEAFEAPSSTAASAQAPAIPTDGKGGAWAQLPEDVALLLKRAAESMRDKLFNKRD